MIENKFKVPLIVPNFLSSDELNHIRTVRNVGSQNAHYPYKFSTLDNLLSNNNQMLIENFITDIQPILEKISNGLKSCFSPDDIAPLYQGIGGFNISPVTIRVLQPEKVDLLFHCENQSIKHFPEFFKHISNEIDLKDMLSFVIMIQRPYKGGSIDIYNEYWINDNEVPNQYRKLSSYEENPSSNPMIQKDEVNLNNGDLLIFEAGKTWHRVAEVYGDLPRITLGGFISKCKNDNNKFYFWS